MGKADILNTLLKSFIDSDEQELEIVVPEPGEVVGTARFREATEVTPERVFQSVYGICVRNGWIHKDLWVNKRGKSVFVRKYDPKGAK